jgi:hypothetical protein
MTHSITAVLVATIIAHWMTRWRTGVFNWRLALLCGAAYGSHLLLDWLDNDTKQPAGIQLLWPFSNQWFISVDAFPRLGIGLPAFPGYPSVESQDGSLGNRGPGPNRNSSVVGSTAFNPARCPPRERRLAGRTRLTAAQTAVITIPRAAAPRK